MHGYAYFVSVNVAIATCEVAVVIPVVIAS